MNQKKHENILLSMPSDETLRVLAGDITKLIDQSVKNPTTKYIVINLMAGSMIAGTISHLTPKDAAAVVFEWVVRIMELHGSEQATSELMSRIKKMH